MFLLKPGSAIQALHVSIYVRLSVCLRFAGAVLFFSFMEWAFRELDIACCLEDPAS